MPGNFFGLIGGDFGIFQTLGKMKGAVYTAMRDPKARIRLRVEDIIRWVAEKDEIGELQAVFRFVQDHFHYVNDPYDIEFFKTPDVLDDEITQYGMFTGDCDDASTYLAALLKSIGYSPYFAVMAPDGSGSLDFSHVLVAVYLPRLEKWVFMDATAKGKPFGWRPASARLETYAV